METRLRFCSIFSLLNTQTCPCSPTCQKICHFSKFYNKMSIQLENHPLENLTASAPAILGGEIFEEVEQRWSSSGGAASRAEQRDSRRKHFGIFFSLLFCFSGK